MYVGIVLNVISSLAFVVSSYLMHYYLGTAMTPAQYGVIGSIITILDFEYLFLNNGVRQSLSKNLAYHKYNVRDVILKCMGFQMVLVLLLMSVNIFGAEIFGIALGDEIIGKYIRFAAILLPVNGLYVVIIGINEGFQRFHVSASTGIVYALAKLSVVVYVGYVFSDEILGTEMGFLTALFVGIIVGGVSLGAFFKGKHFRYREKIKVKNLIQEMFNFSLFFVIVSVVLSMDTLIVKGTIENADMAGYYTGAVNFGKVSYFILQAFFTIVLPTVTYYYAQKQYQKAKKAVSDMMNIILAFVLPITVIISATSGALMRAFYNEKYMIAQNALSILVFAHFFIGVVVMLNMIISAVNKKRFSTVLSVSVLVADIASCVLFTNWIGITGAALAGFLCTLIALIVSVKYTGKVFGAVGNKKSLGLIITNVFLWILIKIVFSYFNINNIIVLGIIYAGIYLVVIFIFQMLHLCDVKELIKSLRRG